MQAMRCTVRWRCWVVRMWIHICWAPWAWVSWLAGIIGVNNRCVQVTIEGNARTWQPLWSAQCPIFVHLTFKCLCVLGGGGTNHGPYFPTSLEQSSYHTCYHIFVTKYNIGECSNELGQVVWQGANFLVFSANWFVGLRSNIFVVTFGLTLP